MQPASCYSTAMAKKVTVIIPAWDEEHSITGVIESLKSVHCADASIEKIIVVDNNSSDRTAERARNTGAIVLHESERGYGAACLRGMEAAETAEIVLFVDADGSDFPQEWPMLVAPIADGRSDLVIGSRVLGNALPGALLPHQRFGNILATALLALLYRTRFSDLGPFRAIRGSSLREIEMRDRDFGWTVEMQIKALRMGLRCMEVPVSYRPRQAGRSKVAGSLRGSFLAGRKILMLVFREILEIGLLGTTKQILGGEKVLPAAHEEHADTG